jgi:hypothetical protein
MVISPHSIFASLLREQFQPAIFKRVDNDACDRPLRIRSADGRTDDVSFCIHRVGIHRLTRKAAPGTGAICEVSRHVFLYLPPEFGRD